MKAPMVNRGVPLYWPKRDIWTSTGEGRLHHTCTDKADLWQIRKRQAEPFKCPKCREHFQQFKRFDEDHPAGRWRVHVRMVPGTQSLELRSLECPRCQAVGKDIGGLGIEEIQCAECTAIRPVTPAGVIEAPVGVNINVPTAPGKGTASI